MTELQNSLLDILKWFNAFCETNNLRYYLLGGTMLGAARHKGFIPWDDDIDVGMPRKDYEKMIKILSGDNNRGKYVLETPDTPSKDFFYAFSKIYDTTTTLIENTKYKIKRGIYIDVFPLDGIGNSEEESKKNFKKVTFHYNMLLSRIGGIRKGRNWFKNVAVRFMRLVPSFILNDKKLLSKVVSTCKLYEYDNCSWVGNLLGAWRFKEIMPKEIIGEPTEYEFEGLKVSGVADADTYLTYLYGDWRKLPPKEKQVSHHDYIMLDLEKPYDS